MLVSDSCDSSKQCFRHAPACTSGQHSHAWCGWLATQDTAVKVFSSRPLLTAGHEHLDCDWEGMWRDVLNDKMEAAHTGLCLQAGWNTSVCLEAHAVKIRDAAAPGECLDCLARHIRCKPELAHSPGVA